MPASGIGLDFVFGLLPLPHIILVHERLPPKHEHVLHESILPSHRCGTMMDTSSRLELVLPRDSVQPRPMLHSSASGRMRIATGDDGVAWKASKMVCRCESWDERMSVVQPPNTKTGKRGMRVMRQTKFSLHQCLLCCLCASITHLTLVRMRVYIRICARARASCAQQPKGT